MKTDSLLGHCIARAMLATGEKPTRWLGVKVTGRASRLCTFIVMYALALRELGEGASHAAVQRWMAESSATFYRRLADFRELFPEYDDPEPVALSLLRVIERELDARTGMQARLALPVAA